MEVRDGDLGRGDEVQVVAGDDVHLVFLVGNLARSGRRRRVDDGGRPDLGHPVLARMDVEEPVDQRSLQRGPRTLVDGEAGAADLRPAGVVDDVERLGELPVWLSHPRRTSRVRADFAFMWLLYREQL